MRKLSETLALGGMSLSDQVVVSATSFLTMFLVAKSCSPSDVGVFALVWTIVGFLRTVQERVISAPYLAFVYRPGFDRPSFRGSSFFHQTVLSSVATTFILIGAFVAAFGTDEGQMAKLLFSMAVMLPLTLLRDQVRALSSAHFQFKSQLIMDVAIGCLQIVGILLIGWYGVLSIAWVNIIVGLACLPPLLVWFRYSGHSIAVDMKLVSRDWSNNWEYSRWLLAARIFGISGYLIVPWLITIYLDKASTGAFSVCNSLVGISLMCVTGANNMFQPRTIKEMHQRGLRRMLMSVIETLIPITFTLGIVSIVFYFAGDQLLATIYGSTYQGYGSLAFILSISTLAVSGSIVLGNGLAALGNSKQYIWCEISCCIVSVGAALILIPTVGLNGGAIALALGGATASLVSVATLASAAFRYAKFNPSAQVS